MTIRRIENKACPHFLAKAHAAYRDLMDSLKRLGISTIAPSLPLSGRGIPLGQRSD